MRHPNRKLSPDEVTDLITAYRGGSNLRALARHFGMHVQTVKAHLRRTGVDLRHWPKLSPDEIDEAARLYLDGCSLYQLGDRFDCDPSTIRRALHRSGVEIRSRGSARS